MVEPRWFAYREFMVWVKDSFMFEHTYAGGWNVIHPVKFGYDEVVSVPRNWCPAW